MMAQLKKAQRKAADTSVLGSGVLQTAYYKYGVLGTAVHVHMPSAANTSEHKHALSAQDKQQHLLVIIHPVLSNALEKHSPNASTKSRAL
jgi:hypothetical protein